MKSPHSTKKTLVIACMLVYFFSACKRNDIPSPTHPPDKPEWLLSKIITIPFPGSTIRDFVTLKYNSFNKPKVLTHHEIGGKGDTTTYGYVNYQYNMQERLIQIHSYDSTYVCGMGSCFWQRNHRFHDYSYDASGRIMEKETRIVTFLEDTSTAPRFITTYSYEDTVVTIRNFDAGTTRIDTYNQQWNLLKQLYAHYGSTHTYGSYDNAPNPIALANLPVHPLYASIDEPVSKNNPMKLVERDPDGQIFYTVDYEYIYNKDSLVTQRISKGGSNSIDNYEYIKAK